MKKTLALILALAMAMSMSACGGKSEPAPAPAETEAPAAETEAPEAEAPEEEAEAPAEGTDYSQIFTKNIEVICPWAAGGSADTNARQMAAVVSEMTGQTVTVTNQTGGSGAIGFSAIMNADPDGNTIGIITAELNTLPPQGLVNFTYQDMYPLMQICTAPSVIAVPADSQFETLEDLVNYAKENPGALKYGTVGTGSIWHICGVKFERAAGIEMTAVPYDGAASAATAMLAGEVDLTTTEMSLAHSYVQSGDMRILGIMTEERIEGYDYPTCREQGYDSVGGSFQGMFCPNDVDDETKAAWEAMLTEAFYGETFQNYMTTTGIVAGYKSHDEWEAWLGEDLEATTALMKEIGLAQ